MPTEVEVEMIPFMVRLLCDCGGEIAGVPEPVLTSYPAQYPHRCQKCGAHSHISGKTYPYLTYKEKS